MHGNMNIPIYTGKAAHDWWTPCSGAYASKPFFKEFLARKGWQIPSTARYVSLSWLLEKLPAFKCLLQALLVLSVYRQWLILWANVLLKTSEPQGVTREGSMAIWHIPKVTTEIKCHFSPKPAVKRQTGQCKILTIKRTSVSPSFETPAIKAAMIIIQRFAKPHPLLLTDGAAAIEASLPSSPRVCQEKNSSVNQASGPTEHGFPSV